MADELTARQRRFVDEYLVDLNATQAAIRAGYSVKTARFVGSENLSKPNIQAAISAGVEAQSRRTGITADVILMELLRSARSDLAEAFTEDGALKPIREIPEDTRRAIASVEVDELTEWTEDDNGVRRKEIIGYTRKVKFWDKTRSLELLGKHLKLFTDIIQHDGLKDLAEQMRLAEERLAAK